MNAFQILDGLLMNLALLIAGVTVITLTYRNSEAKEPPAWLLLRYTGTVVVAFLLMLHSAQLAPGLMFDFRGVMIALAARRYGLIPGLLVALPVAMYRLFLGGPGAWPAVLALLLVALLAGAGTGLMRPIPRYEDEELRRRWWMPFGMFSLANLPVFLAFFLAGKPLSHAWPVYLVLTVLSALGLMVAYGVKQSRLRSLVRAERLEQLVYLDSLTGALNRRRFDEDFRQPQQPAFVLLLDLDDFKHVNDTYGHDQGDRVLRALVQTLQEEVRPTDGVYRLGGEEFAVLLAPCDEGMVPEVAERLRARVQDRVAASAGLSEERITVSGGLVRLTGEKRDVLRAADELLYQAKAFGRNRIMARVQADQRAAGEEFRGTAGSPAIHPEYARHHH
ncbi:sensor domain-containing diguanylate cyclase [Deinococcus hohokamensis]|uniref:Diguanylate cyclase n=1 Tax=Deinococcus hohokamensis TaxID=309883 RepID=A0ABV9IG02_9DEIO